MPDTDLFNSTHAERNPIAFSSPPNNKMGNNVSISIGSGIHYQIKSLELEKLNRSTRILITSIGSLAMKVERRWIKEQQDAGRNVDHINPKLVLFREDIVSEYEDHNGKPINQNYLTNQLRGLKKLGILVPEPEEANRTQPRKLMITSFTEIISGSCRTDKRKKATDVVNHNAQSLAHSTTIQGNNLSNHPEKLEFAIQDVYLNGLFDPVMLLDSKSRGVKHKKKTVWRYGHPLSVEAFSKDDLMVAADQGLARQVFALCKMEVQRRVDAKLQLLDGEAPADQYDRRKLLASQIPNLFVLDEIALAKLTSNNPTRLVSRDAAVNTFIRVGRTQFMVNASDNPLFSKGMSWLKLPSEPAESEFLMKYWEIKQYNKMEDGLRMFVFSIDDHAFQSMLVKPGKPTQFKAPLSLAQEKTSLAHVIHNWVRMHGVEQQEALFDREFGINELYKQLNICVDHPLWDSLSIEEKEKLTANHKRSVSVQLTQLIKKHKVSDIPDPSREGVMIVRALVHGVEIWQVNINSRNRKFRFRIDPADKVIGLPGKTSKAGIEDNHGSANVDEVTKRSMPISVWSLGPEVTETAIGELVRKGLSEDDAHEKIYEWQLINERLSWNSIDEIFQSLNKYVENIFGAHTSVSAATESELKRWTASPELKQALFDEAEKSGILIAQAKFMLTAKIDEFKARYQHKDFASASVIENQFYSYFKRAIEIESSVATVPLSQSPASNKSKQVSLDEQLNDHSWADGPSIWGDGAEASESNEEGTLLIDVVPEHVDSAS